MNTNIYRSFAFCRHVDEVINSSATAVSSVDVLYFSALSVHLVREFSSSIIVKIRMEILRHNPYNSYVYDSRKRIRFELEATSFWYIMQKISDVKNCFEKLSDQCPYQETNKTEKGSRKEHDCSE